MFTPFSPKSQISDTIYPDINNWESEGASSFIVFASALNALKPGGGGVEAGALGEVLTR